MSMNLISLLEIYSIVNGGDILSMFDDYVLDSRLDRTTLNNTIVYELGPYTPCVNNSTVFKMLLDNFFKKYANNITKLIDSMELSYEPLHNKDIFEKVDNAQDTASKVIAGTTGTQEDKVSAFNAQDYQPKDYKTTGAESESELEGTVKEDNLKHTYGKDNDIAYQDLIEKERRLAEFNIYNWIINKLKDEMFLRVL